MAKYHNKPKPNGHAKELAAARSKVAKRRPQKVECEENWGGPCRGGCGKYNSGEFYCADCRKSQAEKNFALRPGEVELWRANVGDAKDKIVRQVVVKDAASVEMEEMAWVWPNRIPDAAITWVMGQPNNGKSLFTVELAACATTGRDWPDGEKNTMPPCRVLMYCGEDSLSKIVVPRLTAAGADMSPGKIGFLDRRSFRQVVGDNDPEKRPLDLGEDLDTLLKLIKANPGYKMIIVDPITGVFGNKSINKNEEANPILEGLIDFCEAANIAFVGVTHVPKRTTNSAIEKIAGGSAVGGSAKSALMLARDTESDNRHDHTLTMVKWNYTGKADGVQFSTVEAEVTYAGGKLKVAKIAWGDAISDIADDVLVAQNAKKENRDRQADKCMSFLQTYLKGGPARSPDVYAAGSALGFGDATVRRALKKLGGDHVDRRNHGSGYWMTLTPNEPFMIATEQQVVLSPMEAGV